MRDKIFASLLIVLLSLSCQKGPKNVGLISLGPFDSKMTETIKHTIEEIYDFQVTILPSIELPKSAFVNIKSPRYRADSLIRILRDIKPDSLGYVLGLTSKDISFTKRDHRGNIKEPKSRYEDWGIFGLGFRPGPSAIISTFRLQGVDKITYTDRIKKIAIHELGHNLGLKHCTNSDNCVMRDAAETIKTIDQVDLILCDRCKKRIK